MDNKQENHKNGKKAGGVIYFNERLHVYYNEYRQIYDSPSKIMKHYKHQFDDVLASQRYAKKHGGTPEYWQNQWRGISDTALDRGSEIHLKREEATRAQGVTMRTGTPLYVRNGDLYGTSLIFIPDGLYPEIVLWNHEYLISGKADEVFVETTPTGRYVDISDFKTNKQICKHSWKPYFRGEFRMMNPPVEHLMDCSWIHYALQLSFYMFMLEAAGFIPRRMEIRHIPHDYPGHDIIYPVPYLKEEIVAILEHYETIRTYEVYEES